MLTLALFAVALTTASAEPASCRDCRVAPDPASCSRCASDARVGNESKPSSKMDFAWLNELDHPQAAAVSAAAALQARADSIASTLGPAAVAGLGDVDVVVSGGGNFDGYYMGIAMVLSRLEATAQGSFKRVRWAGVSAGGMMPYELIREAHGDSNLESGTCRRTRSPSGHPDLCTLRSYPLWPTSETRWR